MMHMLFVLLILAIVVSLGIYLTDKAGAPAPVRWVIYAFLFILTCIVLLPQVGVHIQ